MAGTGEKNNIVDYVEEYFTNHTKQKHILEYDALTSYHDKGIITSMDSAHARLRQDSGRV